MDEKRIEELAKHKINNYLTELWFNVWTFNTTIGFMQKEMTELKVIMKEFIDKADNKFATKEDHTRNEKRIDNIIKILIWICWIIISTVLLAILKLVIVW